MRIRNIEDGMLSEALVVSATNGQALPPHADEVLAGG